jgi:NDP-sugar pyrophosphorylase family protein
VRLPVAILAGGLATRLGEAARDTPKSLLDVAGRPFVAHQLDLLRAAGCRDVVLLVGHLGERIRAAVGDGAAWGLAVRCVSDGPVLLGTGGAVRRARPQLGGAFLVMYGDSYLECDYAAIERAFLDAGTLGMMTVVENADRWDASNVEFVGGKIVRYDKAARTPAMRHIDYGLGAFRTEAFDGWADGERFDLSRVQQALLARGQLAGVEVRQRFYEIGSASGLEETRRYLAAKAGA